MTTNYYPVSSGQPSANIKASEKQWPSSAERKDSTEEKSKLRGAAESAKTTAMGLAGTVGHGMLQKVHEAQEGAYRRKATDEDASSHERKEAAKNALEHHWRAKDESLERRVAEHRAGLPQIRAGANDLADSVRNASTAVGEGVIDAGVAAKDYAVAAGEYAADNAEGARRRTVQAAHSISAAAQSTWHGAREQSLYAQEAVARAQAENIDIPAHARKESAKAALEAHIAARQHGLARELFAHEAGLPALGREIDDVFESAKSQIVSGAWVTKEFLGALGSAAGHGTAEKTHELQASYYQSRAIDYQLSPRTRMKAASKALEHKFWEKQHRESKEQAAARAGLISAADSAKSMLQRIGDTISLIASTVAGYVSAGADYIRPVVQPVANAIGTGANAVAAGAQAAAHKVLESANEAQSSMEQNIAISDEFTASQRKSAAKSALEHHAHAQVHAQQKERFEQDSGYAAARTSIGHAKDVAAENLIYAKDATAEKLVQAKDVAAENLIYAKDVAAEKLVLAKDVAKFAGEKVGEKVTDAAASTRAAIAGPSTTGSVTSA